MTTLVDLLRERTAGDAPLYTFLDDGDDDARSLTARELDTRARRIAVRVSEVASPGDRALLVVPPGLDYIVAFFGCLYAGVIAVPAYPPDPRRLARTLPRLLAIVRAADARVALTTRAIGAVLGMPTIAVDEDIGDAEAWRRPAIDGDTVAMLQFTSGSTAEPRGVILPHASLLANLAVIADAFELAGRPPRVVSWLPPYHDMGLIGSLLGPLYAGGSAIAMSPLHFLQRPARWLRAIATYRADISGGPNFAYDLCVRKVDPATVDLSSWQIAFNGAEVVRAATLERFAETFAPSGFRRSALFPCYGLAETALFATGARRGAGPTIADVGGTARASSGRPPRGVELIVVDPETGRVLADDTLGEIWIAGPSVGRGYWNGDTFGAHTADGRGPFLRTGDLGVLRDGELFVTGRIKDVIVLHARKLFPDDIERVVVAAHPALRPGATAAFAIDDGDREQLVIAQEIDDADRGELRTLITRAVVESFDVTPGAIVLLAKGALPKTSSGKVQRHACRAAYLAGEMRGE